MRRTSGLLLLAIAGILAVVGVQYQRAKARQNDHRTEVPARLRAGIDTSSPDWVYRKENGKCPQVELRAREMESAGEPASKVFLKKVQLRLFHKCGEKYDFIRSDSAEFDKSSGRMVSDGEVEITLAVKNTLIETVTGMLTDEPDKPGRLLTIRATGVSVDVASGKAKTDKKAQFGFDLGDGDAVGASYDPQTRELELMSAVHLTWRGKDPKAKPMKIETERLIYREAESKVFLSPWARLRRDQLTLDSESAEVLLDQGAIRQVDAANAQGSDKFPDRVLNFGAQALTLFLTPKSEIERIGGSGNGRLEAISATARTNVTTERIDLEFEVSPEKGSLLKVATASGNSVVESKPLAKSGAKAPPQATRILKAESIVTRMRPGGEEIDLMETHSPGTLDLIPNAPNQPRRHLKAERMWIAYGDKNQLKSFRAVKTETETVKPATLKQPNPPPAHTTSKDLTADFHPVSGELQRLEQWNDFRYQEGEREATADHATLDAASNLITLARSAAQPARTWDPTGSVAADKIVMHQETGDFLAEGKVSSSRLPEKKKAGAPAHAAAQPNALLADDEPMRATADRMTTTGGNQHVVYEGSAMLWQTANRLQAHRVVIDRGKKTLHAEGNVVSQFLDRKPNPRSGRPVNTVVRAGVLDYSDVERLAHYTAGARMIRDGMDVKSRELRAWLSAADGEGDSRLDRAFADGSVEIFQTETADGRTRRGSADHSEYYVAEEKVVLNGGVAQLVDSRDGLTRGKQLTYFAGNDTLQVEGAITQPVASKIRRK